MGELQWATSSPKTEPEEHVDCLLKDTLLLARPGVQDSTLAESGLENTFRSGSLRVTRLEAVGLGLVSITDCWATGASVWNVKWRAPSGDDMPVSSSSTSTSDIWGRSLSVLSLVIMAFRTSGILMVRVGGIAGVGWVDACALSCWRRLARAGHLCTGAADLNNGSRLNMVGWAACGEGCDDDDEMESGWWVTGKPGWRSSGLQEPRWIRRKRWATSQRQISMAQCKTAVTPVR